MFRSFGNDLAELYQVQTKVLNQAVKRNIHRFPKDFMFQLTEDEYIEHQENLRSQFVTSSFQQKLGWKKIFTFRIY